ncbi:MAG: protein kinase [Nannocystaceae bacterium]|nr:protein kinase [Nannocystaceae bacterium]
MAGPAAMPPVTVSPPEAEDRTLLRPGLTPPPRTPEPPAPTFVPPPAATPAKPLTMEPAPAQWGGIDQAGGTMRAPVTTPTGTQTMPAPSSVAVDSAQQASARGEFQPIDRTQAAAPAGWQPPAAQPEPAAAPAGDKVVVAPEVASSQTMTAGSIARTAAAPAQRPGSAAKRGPQRAAAVASAIGMTPTAAGPAGRSVSNGARLDQQVEAARAAGLTGASAPAVVGRYEVLLRIARGGMGTVYLARVTGEGGFRRLFALKVIRDHLSQNDDYVRMLLQEARIASRLHHPNVVGIVDIGTLANQHYLVMDYVEGCTFSELLKVHRRTRPPHLIVPLMLDALSGLHAAHSLVDDDGSPLVLVHCDFSPQNMLVGTNGICRITDFGIAKAANALHERSSITRGKPAYVSPEQVLGRGLDHRSDIFSAGVVLWNALTGEQLFSGDSPEQTLQGVLSRPIPPPSTVGLRPPSCFDRVCMRALERDPARRYQTAEQMLMDLRRIAIAEDFLAPSSDVGRWVVDTFGRQLELRRQAAGISSRPLGMESQPIALSVSVPELGLGDPELTAETRALPADYGQTPESSASKTTLLRSDVTEAVPPPRPNKPSHAKAIAIGIAVSVITVVIAIGIARPEWIRGGAVDQYGRYGDGRDAPAGDDGKAAAGTDGDGKGDDTSDAKAKPKSDGTTDAKSDADAKTDAKTDAKADAKADVGTPGTSGGAAGPEPGGTAPKTPPAEPGTAEKPVKPKKPKKPKTPPSGDTDGPPPPPDPGEILEPDAPK